MVYTSQHCYTRCRTTITCTPHDFIGCCDIKETSAVLRQVPGSALWRMAPKCEPASRIMTLRHSVVVRLDCRHFAVDAHVSQTAVEAITRRLKRQRSSSTLIRTDRAITSCEIGVPTDGRSPDGHVGLPDWRTDWRPKNIMISVCYLLAGA